LAAYTKSEILLF